MEREHKESWSGSSNEETTVETKAEKVFIIGGGTSARQVIDDGELYDYIHDYTVMCCNKSVEHFYADYLVYHDLKFATTDYPHLVNDFEGKGGVWAPLPSSGNVHLKNGRVNYIKHHADIVFDLGLGLNTGNNCGVTALALSVALGFKEIYLIGMDGCFNAERTQSHFHGGYGHDLSERTYDAFSYFFEKTGDAIKESRPDVKVYNCSGISLIDTEQKYFERIDLSEHITK